MTAIQTARDTLISQLRLLLGDQMVEVELDPEHYNLAITMAIDRIRQRSDGGLEEQFLFITTIADQNEYTLPAEVQEVRRVYRRGVGSNTAGGINFDPFEAAFSNLYLLQSGRTGGLATWDFFAQYQEVIGRLFGSEINFVWDYPGRKLTIMRRPRGQENVLVHVYAQRHEEIILTDVYTGPWARSYALAMCKFMLGEARSKFSAGLPGPNTVSLNGEQLKQEAQGEMERLENELLQFVTASSGMPFTIG